MPDEAALARFRAMLDDGMDAIDAVESIKLTGLSAATLKAMSDELDRRTKCLNALAWRRAERRVPRSRKRAPRAVARTIGGQ